MDDGSLVHVDALGESPKTFRIDVWGSSSISSHEITDNFSMFRRMLWHFSDSMATGRFAIEPDETLRVMRVLMAGKISKIEQRRVDLDEIEI
jgi:hypothetical protein